MAAGVLELDVLLNFGQGAIDVGQLATNDGEIFFRFHPKFQERGLEISPFRLPLDDDLYQSNNVLFEGLPGVFDDSLPDGWGRLLFDRAFEHSYVAGPLDRLANVSTNVLGALEYRPSHQGAGPSVPLVLDDVYRQSQAVLAGGGQNALDHLRRLNGGSAGARPKILVWLDEHGAFVKPGAENHGHEAWIIKFSNSSDTNAAGAVEYAYALMAQSAGLETPKTKLFASADSPGYFGVCRFDRSGSTRFHMHTASGLLHADFRVPSMDYRDLVKLTWSLTKDKRDVAKLFRLAVFNVLGFNRDDHTKNFSYLMNAAGEWRFAPAYDLTPSSGMNGYHATGIMGERRTIGRSHLEALGQQAGFSPSEVTETIDMVQAAIARWAEFAAIAGVPVVERDRVSNMINSARL